MPPRPSNKRDAHSTVGNKNEIPVGADQKLSDNHENGDDDAPFIYRDSSVLLTSHSSPSLGRARSNSRATTSRTTNAGLNNPNNRSSVSIIDDQQSTEPFPEDFDYRATFMPSSPVLSSPPDPRQDVPITRARAKAKAQTLDHVENRNSVHDVDMPKSEKEKDDDDEYRLPESENDNDDTEPSIMGGILSDLKKKPTKKATRSTKSSKRNKQIGTIGVAPTASKKLGRPSTSKAAGSSRKHPTKLNEVTSTLAKKNVLRDKAVPVSRGNVKASAESGDPMGSVTIPDSQDISREPALSSTTQQKVCKSRRPKKPFYPNNLDDQQAKPQAASFSHSNTNIKQQSVARQEGSGNCSFDKMASPKNKIGLVHNQGGDGVLDTSPSEAQRGGGDNVAPPPVDEGKGHAISHSQQPVVIDDISDSSSVLPSSDGYSQSIDMDYGETHPHDSPLSDREAEIIKRPSEPGVSRRPAKKAKVRDTDVFHDNVDAPIRAHVPQLSGISSCYQRVGESPEVRAVADVFEAKPLLPNLFAQGPRRKEESADDDITKYQFSRSLRVHDISGSPRTKYVAAGGGDKYQRAENPEQFPSVKVHKDCSDTESLHPASRAWAQNIAERSRKQNLTSMPLNMTRDTEPRDEVLAVTREFGKNPVSKREILLATRRKAVFDSVHEVTAAVLQHMQSKEATLDDIVEDYRRNGRKLVDTLLNRQVFELRESVSAFDNKCSRLGVMFTKGARLARTVHERVSSQDGQYFRAWDRRNAQLDEEIKKAWEAVASI
ncbi:hypothetical protein GGR55DRAFT_25792 [Xylaria sp. FL0064]|nr:hypothetical protein GGR55DRAFT_25792 [Xylaria sp. FL0064]